MIRLVERDSVAQFERYCAGDPFGCRIVAAERSYGTGEQFAQFWLQYDGNDRITAAVGRLDNGMTVCARGDYDWEEMDAFVEMCVGKTGALRPVRADELATGVVMALDRDKLEQASGETELNPPIEDIYTVLEGCPGVGFDVPPFAEFYNDMLKRMRWGTVHCALTRDGLMPVSCAALHAVDGVGLLTMCATLPDRRGHGHGLSTIRGLLSGHKDMSAYVMCLPGLSKYYEKAGFANIGGFVY